MAKTFEQALSSDLDVQVTKEYTFKAAESARLYALIYLRFGSNVESTVRAINRLMQNNATAEQIVPMIAAGLTIIDDDFYHYNNSAYTEEQDIENNRIRYQKYLNRIK